MSRFSRSGTNWEGRAWHLAPSLSILANQVDAAYPTGHAADGTVASKSHDANNPWSDHRPTPWTGPGRVDAIDVGEVTENDAFNQAEAIRRSRDPRVKYLIHEDRIFSSYAMGSIPPYTWRPYSGPNPHASHYHLSVLDSGANNMAVWDIGTPAAPAPTPPPIGGIYIVDVSRSTLRYVSGSLMRGEMVGKAQALLAAAGFPPANSFKNNIPDKIFGQGCDAATRGFQKAEGVLVDGVIGPVTWGRLEN